MGERHSMPMRSEVDPMFDGHLERPLLALTVSERLDWIWEAMQLLWLGRLSRARNLTMDGRNDEAPEAVPSVEAPSPPAGALG